MVTELGHPTMSPSGYTFRNYKFASTSNVRQNRRLICKDKFKYKSI